MLSPSQTPDNPRKRRDYFDKGERWEVSRDYLVGPEAIRHKYRTLFEALKGTNLADSLIIARDLSGVRDHV